MCRFGERQHRLAAAMADSGSWPEDSPWIREAVAALPRHLFAPDRLWHWDGRAYTPVDRAADPERWADQVYAGPDQPAVTQVAGGLPTSSLSCPSMVADILDSLDPEPGHRILELGTGTGWNAALLAWRAGPGRVISLEVDEEIARAAERRPTGATVVVADGTAGWPRGAPFDRIIATYAVERIPWAWVAQTRPGGRIVAPWGWLGHVALTVAEDGRSAAGWIQGLATFMPGRGAAPARSWRDVRGSAPAPEQSPAARDPRPLHDDAHLLFGLRVLLPDVRIATDSGPRGMTAWLHDGVASWAILTAPPEAPPSVRGAGPRVLADEVSAAWDRWLALGSPQLYDFGVTVTPRAQHVWCRTPAADAGWAV
ncbi:methyltransferase domain-containing protein [Streptomyces johnsoniae]|uniref:Protein-L-isoaspartate O-methyltransferase n=1 Tax=Streptomyces johnsoniae TaxID=3075532 RepID=A0ABU2SDH7_9ACTN|nr:methyltransferase domain-containing protein [Streptomyces sp. DSM 41886]MDT0447032.1 protein-L-isoaspartate O-methyltransferase [Streptomyces sp. DSM 41886]